MPRLITLSSGDDGLAVVGSPVATGNMLSSADGLIVQVNRLLAELVLLGRSPLCVRRRKINRAFELVCVELNPGPKKSQALVLMGGRSLAELKSINLRSSVASQGVPKNKKKKTKKKQISIPQFQTLPRSTMARRSGGMMNSLPADALQYMRVLSNPWDDVPVRLGGETMQPSGIATLVLRLQFALPASGESSFVFYPYAGQLGSSSSILASPSPNAPYTYTSTFGFPGAPALSSLATGGRIIAAGVRVVTTASSLDNSGILTIGCLPRESVSSVLGASSGVTDGGFPFILNTTVATQGKNEFLNYLSTESYPLKCGASAVWRPEDPLDFTFRRMIVSGPEQISPQDLTPFFVVGVTGALGSSVLLMEFVTHIEYTVSEGTTGVINTGMGNMGQQTIIDSAKRVFGGLVDSTFEGVSGAFVKGATQAASLATARALAAASGAFFSSTVY